MATGTAVDVVMPQMGVSVSEGTITKWLKSEGEEIDADEALLEISTDKVDTEIPSPASGVIRQILAQEGDTVAVGTKIAVIAPEGAPSGAPAEAPPEPATQEAADEAAAASGAAPPRRRGWRSRSPGSISRRSPTTGGRGRRVVASTCATGSTPTRTRS